MYRNYRDIRSIFLSSASVSILFYSLALLLFSIFIFSLLLKHEGLHERVERAWRRQSSCIDSIVELFQSEVSVMNFLFFIASSETYFYEHWSLEAIANQLSLLMCTKVENSHLITNITKFILTTELKYFQLNWLVCWCAHLKKVDCIPRKMSKFAIFWLIHYVMRSDWFSLTARRNTQQWLTISIAGDGLT